MIAKPFRDSKKIDITYVSRTCFRHYAVLTKTRSKMTTAISFSRQNDTGSLARALCLLEKLVVELVLVLVRKVSNFFLRSDWKRVCFQGDRKAYVANLIFRLIVLLLLPLHNQFVYCSTLPGVF